MRAPWMRTPMTFGVPATWYGARLGLMMEMNLQNGYYDERS
jgi:hypothetical protein